MSFKKDIPDYKSYPDEDFLMKSVPNEVWSELSGFILRYSEDNEATLLYYLNQFSKIIPCEPTSNWSASFLITDTNNFVQHIKRKVENGRFDVFMDCLAVLVDGVSDRIDNINDFLEEHNIGYVCTLDYFSRNVHWKVKKPSNIIQELYNAKDIVKTSSQQAYDEFERAIKSLEDASDDRARKDAVRSCVSAMEAVVKAYGKEDDIGNSTKKLRNEKIWGLEDIVKEGHSIFNAMHRFYPDLRHGSIESSDMTIEEAEYWIGRISNYLKYMRKMADKNGIH